ncbi:unnamed protein product [Auanema sp. JU1783]|nr:unnamed protein product [Auanema sp. JU1783]
MCERIRRVTVYETAGRFYLVGCDASATKFNVLKIDRVDSKVLLIGETEATYSRDEVLELLATVSDGNSVVIRYPSGKKPHSKGLIERVSNAYGILGAVRFLEGYYLILITKATSVATIGYHTIYKVAEVAMISITMDGVSVSSEEQRYVRLFQSVDLSTDFYFSYSYDLSRTLQENALKTDWDNNGTRILTSDPKFVWNNYLLDPLRNNNISQRWCLEIIHGYINQQLINLPCNKLSLTLIGRRSAVYAGTRFLKRGANLKGNVANDVETEQILWDVTSSLCFKRGRFSAFSQRRGSVPLRWSQDPATRGVVGKPLILIDIHEPHAQTAGAHFREMRKKYGSPIIVMNLVKRREKRRHEGLLHEQFLKSINYLNIFLPTEEKICYLSFDVARCNKSSTITSNVLTKMDEIAMKAVRTHGWFQSFPIPNSHQICPRFELAGFTPHYSQDKKFLLQRGVSRTNCVDCLDRTNVAQFAIGKAALGCQLCAMGLVDTAQLSLQSEVCRVYEEMFDAHGDTLAWQYAGSQLVHSIKTYKKTSAFQERSRDVLQTLSRYYSNTFADYDKQAAINLFLGIFRPMISSTSPLWDLPTDYYLHFPNTLTIKTDYCAWMYDDEELEKIQRIEFGETIEEETKAAPSAREISKLIKLDACDDYRNHYRTFELTSIDVKIKNQILAEQRTVTVSGINQDVSTTGQFMKLWKTESKDAKSSKKQARESDDDDEEGEEENKEDVLEVDDTWVRLTGAKTEEKPRKEKEERKLKSDVPILAAGLLFAKDKYGLQGSSLSKIDRALYKSYVAKGGLKVDTDDWHKYKPTLLTDLHVSSAAQSDRWRTTAFSEDDIFQTEEPRLSKAAIALYTKSCDSNSYKLAARDKAIFGGYPRYI